MGPWTVTLVLESDPRLENGRSRKWTIHLNIDGSLENWRPFWKWTVLFIPSGPPTFAFKPPTWTPFQPSGKLSVHQLNQIIQVNTGCNRGAVWGKSEKSLHCLYCRGKTIFKMMLASDWARACSNQYQLKTHFSRFGVFSIIFHRHPVLQIDIVTISCVEPDGHYGKTNKIWMEDFGDSNFPNITP